MSISLIFSIAIYQVSYSNIHSRVDNFQTNIQKSLDSTPDTLLETIIRASNDINSTEKLMIELVYINIIILILGGFISYYLARRNLQPIKEAHEAQSRFTSDTSHELRTPLAVMRTELEVALRDKDATTESLKDVLSSNLEEVNKLSNLAEMLLNLSQIGNTNIKFESVNLNKVTKEVIKNYKFTNKRINFKNSKNQIVTGNEMAITDLVKVLIDNAVQYSPCDSVIDIDITQKDGSFAQFKISNAGQGIQSDKIPYVFDRFYRADKSRTNGDHKGYGLGLALAKNIVELHNGKISVTSTPDVETVFIFKIPKKSVTKK